MTQLVKIDRVAKALTMGCEVETLAQRSSPHTMGQSCCGEKGLDQKDARLPPTSEMHLDTQEASTRRF